MKHTCHAAGCTRTIAPKFFMCPPDWATVRAPLQRLVWREYRPGQEVDKDASNRYLAVTHLCIAEVAWSQRAKLPNALKLAARALSYSDEFRQLAMDEGKGDPLDGLPRVLPLEVTDLAATYAEGPAKATQEPEQAAPTLPGIVVDDDRQQTLFGPVQTAIGARGSRLVYVMRAVTEGGHLQAHTQAGHLIGTEEKAQWLSARGIAPELATPASRVCSVGFCVATQKWWGWHNRTAKSFGVGSTGEWGKPETTPTATPEQIAKNPDADMSVPVGFVARTLKDARRMAVAFAVASGAK